MKEEKIKRLEENGWKVGTVSDFLKLSRKEEQSIKTKKGSQNVYADLGIPDAKKMLVKAQLATIIAEIIKRRKLTQTQAASLLGMTQSKLSNMLRGRFRGISETKMLECMTLLGRDVQIVVKPVSRSRKTGHVSVLFA
jgi:predicted XRE-type DNA-binding protein